MSKVQKRRAAAAKKTIHPPEKEEEQHGLPDGVIEPEVPVHRAGMDASDGCQFQWESFKNLKHEIKIHENVCVHLELNQLIFEWKDFRISLEQRFNCQCLQQHHVLMFGVFYEMK